MRLTLEVNEVTPGSFTKGDKTFKTLELLCTDKSEGPRLKHAVIFSVKADQHEVVTVRSLRDKRIDVEVDEIKPNFSGAITLRGLIVEGTLPPANGKLEVKKPS
jgi:hypothetical protein